MNRIVFVIAILFAGCARTDEHRNQPSSEIAGHQPLSIPADFAVTERGIGPLRAGMTVAEAKAVFPSFEMPPGTGPGSGACDYAAVKELPRGVRVLVEDGVVGRVDVDTSTVPTAAGARVGDSEARIKSLYPNQVNVSPHKYTDGHYLTVTPRAKSDSAFRIIFETDGKRVINYRAGQRPQVEYVEGCA
ncbi:MAG: hypothetical protein ABJB95_00820 [Gemmatimonadales bacterium]